jgi:ComF family protein
MKAETSYWENFLDLLFPRFNDLKTTHQSYLPSSQWPKIETARIDFAYDNLEYLEDILVAGKFHANPLEKLIDRAKFFGETAICSDLAKLLHYQVIDTLPVPDLLTFVPPDHKRLLERGYHIPQILAQHLAISTKSESIATLTKKTASQRQTNLSREERLKNNQNNFQIIPENLAHIDKQQEIIIWLVDDVITTGATILECAKTLKKELPNSRIFGLAIAH